MEFNEARHEQSEIEVSSVRNLLDSDAINAIHGLQPTDGDVSYDWVDRGIIDVPVSDLPDSPDIQSPEDFHHHISWEDAKKGVEMLPEIQEDLAAGKTYDDFKEEDLAKGIQGTGGKSEFYNLFYGEDPIKLTKIDDTYDVTGGRHRIAAAKLCGLDFIPARVTERVLKQ